MDKNAVQSIFGLLDAGCIDREQAVRLLSEDNNKKVKSSNNRSVIVENIVNNLMYGDEAVRGLRLDEIFYFMNSVNWKWYNEPVNDEGFKHILTGLVKDCIHEIIDNDKDEYSIYTAGIRVHCYCEDNDNDSSNPYIVTDVEFIADSNCNYTKLSDF